MKLLSGNSNLTIEQSENIYLKISSYTSSGFNIKDALIKIKNNFEKADSNKVSSLLGKWEQRINDGMTFSEAIRPDVSPLEYQLMSVSEHSKRIAVGALELAYILNSYAKIKPLFLPFFNQKNEKYIFLVCLSSFIHYLPPFPGAITSLNPLICRTTRKNKKPLMDTGIPHLTMTMSALTDLPSRLPSAV